MHSWRLRGAVAHQARVLIKLVERYPDLDAGKINTRLGHSLPEIAAGIAAGGGVSALVSLLVRHQ